MSSSKAVRVLDGGESCPMLPLVEGEGMARAVIWPGVGAQLRSMQRIRLAPGARTITLRHPMEAVYYVMSGAGTVLDLDAPPARPLVEGAMLHVEPGTAYLLQGGPDGIEILGGPCPADPALYAGLGTSPQHGPV
jgi:quercetin dioxygenase-like cupin family protein